MKLLVKIQSWIKKFLLSQRTRLHFLIGRPKFNETETEFIFTDKINIFVQPDEPIEECTKEFLFIIKEKLTNNIVDTFKKTKPNCKTEDILYLGSFIEEKRLTNKIVTEHATTHYFDLEIKITLNKENFINI